MSLREGRSLVSRVNVGLSPVVVGFPVGCVMRVHWRVWVGMEEDMLTMLVVVTKIVSIKGFSIDEY